MKIFAKVIGRLIALLVNSGVITREEGIWVLEALKEEKEGGDGHE